MRLLARVRRSALNGLIGNLGQSVAYIAFARKERFRLLKVVSLGRLQKKKRGGINGTKVVVFESFLPPSLEQCKLV
jgi:hypothetical protein